MNSRKGISEFFSCFSINSLLLIFSIHNCDFQHNFFLFCGIKQNDNLVEPSNSFRYIKSHEIFNFTGSSRYPYHENSSSDSEEEILRRLKLQQSISLQSGQIARYGGFSSPLNQSIHLDGFQPISIDNGVSLTSSKPIKYNSSKPSSLYNNGHRYSGVSNNNGRDLLGQAERGKIGSHTSSECSSNSSVEASVESNMGLLNHEKKGDKLFQSSNDSVVIYCQLQTDDK